MTAAASGKAGIGNRKLMPFYVGISEHKSLANVVSKHTHYVMIEQKVAVRLGLKQKGSSKPGGSDVLEANLVHQTNRKGKKGTHTAKRVISQGKRKITAHLDTTVKNKAGKEVTETYSMGFPSGVPLRLIIKFFKDNCPRVARINSSGNMYQVR
jgi:hypothetical protein